MSITYEQAKPHLECAAKKFNRMYPSIDKDEFISEAWIRGVGSLTNPKFIKNRTIFAMLDFVRNELGLRRKCKPPVTNKMEYLDWFISEGEEAYSFVDNIETEDFFSYLIEKGNLTDNQGMIIYMYYYLSMDSKKITEVLGISKASVFSYLNNGMKKIRKVYIEKFGE